MEMIGKAVGVWMVIGEPFGRTYVMAWKVAGEVRVEEGDYKLEVGLDKPLCDFHAIPRYNLEHTVRSTLNLI